MRLELFVILEIEGQSPSAEGQTPTTVSSPQMIKSFAAFAIMSLLGVSVIALPGFAPQVEARQSVALAKADRLPIRPIAQDCSRQVWPNFETSCLRNSEIGTTIREARLVTARR
jgi:hypothetical protein